EEGKGTRVSARFGPADASALPAGPPVLPVGDIPGTLRTVLLFEGPGEVVIKRTREDGTVYEIRKTELTRVLGELGNARAMILLDRYLREIEGGLRLNAD
ncbi:MAG: hypothetical protein LBL20_00780, partial [Treponema sp.]|nr:hypothetical protein [Treponema sp.]